MSSYIQRRNASNELIATSSWNKTELCVKDDVCAMKVDSQKMELDRSPAKRGRAESDSENMGEDEGEISLKRLRIQEPMRSDIVNVKTLNGQTLRLKISADNTSVCTIKQLVYEKTGIHPDRYMLVQGGVVLHDHANVRIDRNASVLATVIMVTLFS